MLFLVGFFSVVSSIFQGGVCGLAGKFPKGYVNAVISGQALGGIFAALANIISIALGASPTQSAFIYFLAADVTLILAFVMYLILCSTVRNQPLDDLFILVRLTSPYFRIFSCFIQVPSQHFLFRMVY